MFDAILESIKGFKISKKKSDLKRFLIYGNKFHLMIEIIYYSLLADKNDIFYKTLEDPDWILLLENLEVYEPNDLKKFLSEF